MLSWKGRCRLNSAVLTAVLLALVLPVGCSRSEPEKKITYTPVPGALESQNQPPSNPAGQNSAASGAPAGKPNDPMNDPELASKGHEILQRTGGDVNKMTEAEKKTFFEAAKNGHL